VRLYVVCVALFAVAVVLPAQDPVVVMLQFDEAPALEVVNSLHEELEALFEAADIRLDLRHIQKRPLRKRHERAAVVHFSKGCVPPIMIRRGEFAVKTLAHVHQAGNRVLDLVEVNCRNVSDYLSTAMTTSHLGRLNQLYGRGLARVVAHELLHWMLNERNHTKSRLFCRHVQAQDLIAEGVTLGHGEIARLRRLAGETSVAGGL
jgi:hypothetical protein